MKVLFVIEYFPPFYSGGSEWSTFNLAKELAKIGEDVIVITPNYGAKKTEKINNIKIIRFPFYIKLKNYHNLPGNFTFTNPLWTLWVAINLFLVFKKEKADIIYVQGKYSLPPAYLANIFFKTPLIATIRDYIAICNYGMCLMESDKTCNIYEYFFRDFREYLNIYVIKKNFINISKNLVFAIWGRFSKNYLKYFLNHADLLTSLSKKQKSILVKNGINVKIKPLYTNYIFKTHLFTKTSKQNVLFVGRLTYGKGIRLFLDAISLINRKNKNLTFTIIGEGPFAYEVSQKAKYNKSINYIPHIEHDKLINYFQKSMVLVVPSIWPDPLPRVAMEAISSGTPVVATDSGGLPEIVKNNRYGYLSKKIPSDLAIKIMKAIKNQNTLRENIKSDLETLTDTYGSKLAYRYLSVYQSLIINMKFKPE